MEAACRTRSHVFIPTPPTRLSNQPPASRPTCDTHPYRCGVTVDTRARARQNRNRPSSSPVDWQRSRRMRSIHTPRTQNADTSIGCGRMRPPPPVNLVASGQCIQVGSTKSARRQRVGRRPVGYSKSAVDALFTVAGCHGRHRLKSLKRTPVGNWHY